MQFNCLKCKNNFEARRSKMSLCRSCYFQTKKTEWYQANKTNCVARGKKWRLDNPERAREVRNAANRVFYARNRKKMLAYHVKKNLEARQRNPMAKLRHAVRRNLHSHFYTKNVVKNKKSVDYIGCSWKQLWDHFDKQFQPHMNWNNYGKVWTIEHICPCAQAQDKQELLKLQHFSNLMPLDASLNLKKSSNYTPEAEKLCQTLLGREWRVI